MQNKIKNFVFISLLIFSAIFSLPANITASTSSVQWYYTDNFQTQNGPYNSEPDCVAALQAAKKASTFSMNFGPCVSKTIVQLPPSTDALPVPIDALNNASPDGTYHLLAPIYGLKSVSNTGVCPTDPSATNGIGCYLNLIFKIGIGLCGALAVIMIIIGGVQYMGTESVFGKTEAKGKIMSAILGLFIALGAFAILNTINPDLTGQNGVNVDQVTATIEEENITDVGPGVTVGNSHVGIKKGSVTGCSSGVVDIPSDIPTTKSGKICKDLLAKLYLLKSKNTNWQITSTVSGTHLSSCHSDNNPKTGNCADIQIKSNPRQGYNSSSGSSNPAWSDLCVAIAQIGGVNFANEASSSQNCQGIKNFKTFSTTTGPNLHINYIGG